MQLKNIYSFFRPDFRAPSSDPPVSVTEFIRLQEENKKLAVDKFKTIVRNKMRTLASESCVIMLSAHTFSGRSELLAHRAIALGKTSQGGAEARRGDVGGQGQGAG